MLLLLCRWSRKPLKLVLSRELWPRLELYCYQCWTVIRAEGTSTLFMQANGQPFSPSRFTQVFGELLAMGGTSFSFPPSRLRHIFVEERLTFQDMPGPSHEAAAHAMGNSVETWVKHYHTTYSSMAASRAVEEMAAMRDAFREQLAQEAVQQQQQQQLEQQQDELEGVRGVLGMLDVIGEDTDDSQFDWPEAYP